MVEHKHITVSELYHQLEKLIELGKSDSLLTYRDSDSMDYPISEGVWDLHDNYITLG